MGECGRSSLQLQKSATSVADDMSVARDIARRFEQLETQWLSFQQKSAKWEADKDTLCKGNVGSLPNCRLPADQPSPASSYSNPLFTNHTMSFRSPGIGEGMASASSRTGSPHTTCSPLQSKTDNTPFSTIQCTTTTTLLSSTQHNANSSIKDDNLSSSTQVPPIAAAHPSSNSSTPLLLSPSPGAAVNTSKCRHLCPPCDDDLLLPLDYTKATIPTFYNKKPPLISPAPTTTNLKGALGCQPQVSCVSLSRLSLQSGTHESKTNSLASNLNYHLQESCDPSHLLLEATEVKVPLKKPGNSNNHDEGIIESLASAAASSTSNTAFSVPLTHKLGKHCPPKLQTAAPMLDCLGQAERVVWDQIYPCISRSPPPFTPRTLTADAELQLDPSSYGGVSLRNVSWGELADTRASLNGVTNHMRIHTAENDAEEGRVSSPQMPGCTPETMPSKNGNTLKLEVQIANGNKTESQNPKLGDRLGRVNWELRLSKREAALRIAEERLLEEQQKLSERQLSLARSEDTFSQREEAAKNEKKHQSSEITESLKLMDTGKAVMKKLCAALYEVLLQMEQKEKVLQNAWGEIRDSAETKPGSIRNSSYGFEPELSGKNNVIAGTMFDGISTLAAEGKCEEWCSTVIGICERLVSFMSRETHLQQWATVLEREGTRLATMEEEMEKAKKATLEQQAAAEAMMKSADEKSSSLEEERIKIVQERENLILWVSHLQERRKAVTECEREVAASLAHVQKKSAELFVRESSIDGRSLEISALQEELRATSQRLHDDQDLVNCERSKVQEKLRQVSVREREADSKMAALKRLQDELDTKMEQLERERFTEEKKREKLALAHKETEEKLNAKEMLLQALQKEFEHKNVAAQEMANNLNARDKVLQGVQKQLEQENFHLQEMIADMERDKERLKDAERATAEAQDSRRQADNAWARATKERNEAAQYLISVRECVTQWEDRLHSKEKELMQQQKTIQEVEDQAREEQEQSEGLHAKLVQEQESWTEELKCKQEVLAKHTKLLENKEAEIKRDLEILTEERRLAINEIKRFAEMESRIWEAERDLQTKHEQHLQEVQEHTNEYHAHVENLETAKQEVEKEFAELHAKKQELQIWRREAEETLQNRIDSFVKGKEELTSQIQELKKLQVDIEQAGSQIVDRVAELDQASCRLERQRHKVETSKSKLEVLADKLAKHQEVLKQRESDLVQQETKLVAVQTGLKLMAAEAATKEKNLRFREQAVIDSENDLHELEGRLANERRDLEKMIAEVEQHAATLKEETVSAEESIRNRTREELLIQEEHEKLQSKEKELASLESALKKKAKIIEEHGQTISMLEMQVKDRLQRSADLETKALELEKGREELKEEQTALAYQRESLTRVKSEIQKAAATQRIKCLQWKVEQGQHCKEDCTKNQMLNQSWLREEMERQRAEIMEVLHTREAAIDAREAKACEREAALQKLEQQGKEHVKKDAEELQHQLTSCTHTELQCQQQCYVDEKQKAAETLVATIEEREVRLKLREKTVENRDMSLTDREGNSSILSDRWERQDGIASSGADLHDQRCGVLGGTGGKNSVQELFGVQHSGTQDSGTREMLAQPGIVLHKQGDEVMEGRFRQMEDTFKKEAAKILQERANLKLQQQDLEETRKAVQEVKVTLSAQLKETKQMVSDASITAQNASREREALEEERKWLSTAHRNAESSLAAKEAKLALEAKQLEDMKNLLEQEKGEAMVRIQQAAKRAVDEECAKVVGNNKQWETSLMMHKEIQSDADLKDREMELNSTAQAIQREKMSLEQERAKVKILHDALEREQMEKCYIHMKQSAKAEGVIKDADSWEEINKRWEARPTAETHNWHPIRSEMPFKEKKSAVEQSEPAFPTLKSGLEDGSLGHMLVGSSSRNVHDFSSVKFLGPDHNNHNSGDDSFRSTMLSSTCSSMAAATNEASPEKLMADSSFGHMHEGGGGVPSRKRLENVMTSLMHARQASRSRLQRTENALLAFPSSARFTAQVQRALNALSARLGLMEQIEEGLENHLQKAYEVQSPESEGIIVDKVQLLCRMEEQQSLRAEWEEDMQQQLETISMLQAASRNSSDFNISLKLANSNPPPIMMNWRNEDDKSHAAHDIVCKNGSSSSNGTDAPVPYNHAEGGGFKPSRQYPSPEWNTTFEPLLGVDSKALSYSPLVEYSYISSSAARHHSPRGGGREGGDNHDRKTQRKLQWSPPNVVYS
ncbi:hypothetical protein BDL97_03G136100 [Sphagnum fallax]|nr:hypothetical protein BDL97_03G136100 [Sphagnum fallax]